MNSDYRNDAEWLKAVAPVVKKEDKEEKTVKIISTIGIVLCFSAFIGYNLFAMSTWNDPDRCWMGSYSCETELMKNLGIKSRATKAMEAAARDGG